MPISAAFTIFWITLSTVLLIASGGMAVGRIIEKIDSARQELQEHRDDTMKRFNAVERRILHLEQVSGIGRRKDDSIDD